MSLFPILLRAFASTTAKAEDVIEDDDDTNATITIRNAGMGSNPEPDIAGYNVYYGRVSGDYTRLVTVTDPTATIG